LPSNSPRPPGILDEIQNLRQLLPVRLQRAFVGIALLGGCSIEDHGLQPLGGEGVPSRVPGVREGAPGPAHQGAELLDVRCQGIDVEEVGGATRKLPKINGLSEPWGDPRSPLGTV
jgi:hypothetical protein